MPTPNTTGGQGLEPACFTVSTTKRRTPSTPSAGLSMASRLMFSEPKPLGATVMVHLFPGTSRRVMAAGVLSGVYPPQGVGHNGFAEIALPVAPLDSCVDGLLKVPLNMDLLAQLHKHTGHSRVLTDGELLLPGQLQIVPQQAQCLLSQGPRFLTAAPGQGGHDVGGELGVGPDTQPGHCVGDGGGRNGPHIGYLPEWIIV